MRDAVLSLCDLTATAVKPWADAGLECWCVDLQHDRGEHRVGNVVYVGADVLRWCPPSRRWVMAFAFPPCTHLASSGARWFAEKGLDALADALHVVEACRRMIGHADRWCLENPVGRLSTCWRKPDLAFDPCEYAGWLPADRQDAEAYTKRTCLWTGGMFREPERKPVPPVLGSLMHRLPPSDDRANLRSATPEGWALAVFDANRPEMNQ